jgi:hypothetical protein
MVGNMKIAFITEMGFSGKIPVNHPNMRTEFAWMNALDADHFNLTSDIFKVRDYDKVFIIFPKGKTFLSAEGSKLIKEINPVSSILNEGGELVELLKRFNKSVYFIQEGPSWWFNDYELVDQINFINMIKQSDGIYAHNEYDKKFWLGFTEKVYVIPTLMIEESIKDISWNPQDKVIIGGNFSRWYGGMQSYVVAQHLDIPIYTITSHSTRLQEEQLVTHLPRVLWTEWMKQLSEFKYAVHLMPTVAAGTFSLNCAYFGIPCIGNEKVDTQRLCHPLLSVDCEDVEKATQLVIKLKNDKDFYYECSVIAKENERKHYDINVWKEKLNLC